VRAATGDTALATGPSAHAARYSYAESVRRRRRSRSSSSFRISSMAAGVNLRTCGLRIASAAISLTQNSPQRASGGIKGHPRSDPISADPAAVMPFAGPLSATWRQRGVRVTRDERHARVTHGSKSRDRPLFTTAGIRTIPGCRVMDRPVLRPRSCGGVAHLADRSTAARSSTRVGAGFWGIGADPLLWRRLSAPARDGVAPDDGVALAASRIPRHDHDPVVRAHDPGRQALGRLVRP
jgi:hypothetical protein